MLDSLNKTLRRFFDGIVARPGIWIGGAGMALLMGVGVTFWMKYQTGREEQAQDQLYLARHAIEKTLEKGGTEAGAEKSVKKEVDLTFSEPIQKLRKLIKDYPGTRAAFQANLELGDLYYEQGEPMHAIPWYQAAVISAPKSLDRALALYSLGYAYENSGKLVDALQNYEKSLNLGQGELKGEILLAMGRCQQNLQDSKKARALYDQIFSQLPNTEYAKKAEILKARLQ